MGSSGARPARRVNSRSDGFPSASIGRFFFGAVPYAWRHRRLRIPHPRLLLHYANTEQRAWSGSVPITAAARTVNDCAKAAVAPDLVEQACREGLRRGLFQADEIVDATNQRPRRRASPGDPDDDVHIPAHTLKPPPTKAGSHLTAAGRGGRGRTRQ